MVKAFPKSYQLTFDGTSKNSTEGHIDCRMRRGVSSVPRMKATARLKGEKMEDILTKQARVDVSVQEKINVCKQLTVN